MSLFPCYYSNEVNTFSVFQKFPHRHSLSHSSFVEPSKSKPINLNCAGRRHLYRILQHMDFFMLFFYGVHEKKRGFGLSRAVQTDAEQTAGCQRGDKDESSFSGIGSAKVPTSCSLPQGCVVKRLCSLEKDKRKHVSHHFTKLPTRVILLHKFQELLATTVGTMNVCSDIYRKYDAYIHHSKEKDVVVINNNYST